VAFTAVAALWLFRPAGPETAIAAGAAPGIAVLPFEAQGEGLEPWEERMVDLLSTNLDGVAGLRAIDSRSVLARWRDRSKKEQGVPDALEMAREVGARYALVGSATAVGPSVRLSVSVHDVEKDSTLGRARVEGSADSLFALVDRLSIDVLRTILPSRGGGLPSFDLARATTSSMPALEWFLEGEAAYRRADFPSAVAAYERAIEADSTFALASLRLASTYGWTENVQLCLGGRAGRVSQADEEKRLTDLGWVAIQRAVRLADRLTERDAILARAYYALFVGDLHGIEPVRIAVQRYPDDVEMWYILGELYWHLGPQALIPEDEVERALAKSIALDPRFSPAYFHRVHLAYGAVDTARTQRLLDAMTGSVDPSTTWYRQFRYAYPLAYGDEGQRERALEAIDTLPIPFMSSIGFNLRAPAISDRRSRVLSMALRRATEPGQVGSLAGTAATVLMQAWSAPRSTRSTPTICRPRRAVCWRT
jgi:serine/threonine-protein kinase